MNRDNEAWMESRHRRMRAEAIWSVIVVAVILGVLVLEAVFGGMPRV